MPFSRLRTANKSMRRDKPKQSIPIHINPIYWVNHTDWLTRKNTIYYAFDDDLPFTPKPRRLTNGPSPSKTRIIPTTDTQHVNRRNAKNPIHTVKDPNHEPEAINLQSAEGFRQR